MGNELLRRLERLGGASYKVPQQVEEVLEDLRLGRLVIRSRDDQQRQVVSLMSLRIFTALLVAPLVISSAFLYAHQRDQVAFVFLLLALSVFILHLLSEFWCWLRPPR